MSSADTLDTPVPEDVGAARHILTFAAILFAVLFVLGIVEGFVTAGAGTSAHGLRYGLVGYLAHLVAAMLVFRLMTLRRDKNAFRHAASALLAQQAFGFCVALLLMLAWPSLGAPDLKLAALEFAVLFAGMMLGVAWGLHTAHKTGRTPGNM